MKRLPVAGEILLPWQLIGQFPCCTGPHWASNIAHVGKGGGGGGGGADDLSCENGTGPMFAFSQQVWHKAIRPRAIPAGVLQSSCHKPFSQQG